MIASHIVPPSAIQSSLDDLWNDKENKNKIRASLFNLIFFTQKSPREEYIRKIAYKILEKFPARIFFISADPSSSDSLKTAVAVISTQQGEFEITCDLIEISAPITEEDKIPFILLPHLIPDLPVFLVWAEDPALRSNLYEDLKSFATRVIFDSESTEDLSVFAKSILAKEKNGFFEIADLNWARLESWRSLISSTFSDFTKLEKLKDLNSITITYNAQETPFFCHTKIQSIYLQAWIASRLKWKLHEKTQDPSLLSFFYKSTTKDIEVKLQSIKNIQLPPGMILSLNLSTSDGEQFIFSRDEKHPSQISFEYSTDEKCSLPTYTEISKGESGKSLVKEICHKGTSSHYIDVLELIIQGNLPC